VPEAQALLFPVRERNRHPARYTPTLLPVMARLLAGARCILDPCAGTGRVHDLSPLLPGAVIVGNELEWEWAAWRRGNVVGNALALPFADGAFDAVCVSPAYGNRMADHHEACDASRRNTYRHALGRPLHPNNAGQLQWGEVYRRFHVDAWTEARRVLAPGGRFVLNVADHIRDGQRQQVTAWHIGCLCALSFRVLAHERIETPGLRVGANAEKRVGYESVVLLERI
jgi:SAM-dependent methyltransferase